MLLGRGDEQTRIDGVIAAAAAGRGGAIVFVGEPGIGKTSLLDYARDHARGATIVATTGVESELELPFAGLVGILQPLLGHVPELAESRAAFVRAALALGPPGPVDRLAAGAAVLALLAAAAGDGPLLVLVDDAQWLDAAARDALLFAARRLGADPIALIMAARDTELESFESAGIETVVLGGLGAKDAATLLDGVVDPAAVGRLVELTRGNPLGLLQLPATLSEAQLLGRAPVEEPLRVSAGIERAFARRVLALGEDVRRALLIAAADDTGGRDVIDAAAREMGAGATGLEVAEDAGLLRLDGARVAFHHPLVRAAVYQDAAPSERRDTHRALAAVLAGRDEFRHAWHAAAAATGPDEAAARALASVAAKSRARGAYSAAAAAFERAARLAPERDEAHGLVAQAADCAWLAGRPAHAASLVDEGLAGRPSRVVRADLLALRGRMSSLADDQERAYDAFVEAAQLVEDIDPGRSADFLVDAIGAGIQLGAAAVAGPAARLAALDVEEQPFRELRVAEALLAAASMAGDPDGVARLEQSLAAVADDALDESPLHLFWAGRASFMIARNGDAARLARRAIDRARQEGALAIVPQALRLLAHADFDRGRWRTSYAAAGEAVEVATELEQFSTVCACRALLAEIHAAVGDEEPCRAEAAAATAIAAERGLAYYRERAERAVGRLELVLGRTTQAIAQLEAVHARLRAAGNREPNVTPAWDLVEAYARMGALEDARTHLSLAEDAAPPASPAEEAVIERCRGIVAGKGAYEARFGRALALHDAHPFPFERARTELVYGERLRRDGKRRGARDRLRSALSAFEELGATAWAARARSELAATGERLRATVDARESLTPREMQVALAVAQGASNNEVAAALFVTPKTVEYHLTRVYRKLGLRSRADVARRFAANE